MSDFLWVAGSLIAYIGGLMIILRMTPRLLASSYDEGLFLGVAAFDIMGALLAFGAAVVTFALFNGALGVRILDFLFLGGILIVGLRMTWMSYRPPRLLPRMVASSRIIAIVYSLCLAIAALYYIVFYIL